MKYSIRQPDNEEIAGNMLPQCGACFSQCKTNSTTKIKCSADGLTRRLGLGKTEQGLVLLCSPDKDDVNSSKVFRSRMSAYVTILSHVMTVRTDMAAAFNQQMKRLLHNLTSLNAHCIQEIFDLVSQDTLTKNISQQLKTVQNVLKASPQKAARTILRIAKNNLAMKSEFVAMRYLEDASPHPQLRVHQIQKVVLNVLHAFFQDFTDHSVRVYVNDSPFTVLLDYDTFHVALYHVFDNATKYIMPNSELIVSFEAKDGRVKVVLDMLSLPISPQELARLGEEGFSGSLAIRLQLAGHGLGMFRTKRLLTVNRGLLNVQPNISPSKVIKHNGITYEYNRFVFSLLESTREGRIG